MNLFWNEQNKANIEKAMRREKVDSVPYHFSDQLDFLSGLLGTDGEMYHFDAEVKLKAQIEFNKRFSGCGIMGPNFGVALEPSAFGAEITYNKDTPPWVAHMVTSVEEIPEFVKNLKIPNPVTAGQLPLFYQTYFHMQTLTNNQIGSPLGAIAPIDIASLLVGFDNLCLAMLMYPETTHELMEKIKTFLINFIETKIKMFGVQKVGIIDMYGDYAGYLSVDLYKEYIVPYNKAIYDHFNADVNLYHCDGPLEHLIEVIPDMGCNCLYDFDPETDIKKFVDKIGDKVCLMGNIHPIKVMRNGSVDDVIKVTKEIVLQGKKAKGFVFSNGGELANGTPPENILAAIETVEKYGKY